MAICVVGVSQAHAELTIWQVENNPPGSDSGNEWLTVINTGESGTFSGYGIQTTHGRIASYDLPSTSLDTCEYYTFKFPKQAIDNEDDTVKLLKDGRTIYETDVIKDTKNNDRFWTNPDVAGVCETASTQEPTSTESLTIEQRIEALEQRTEAIHEILLNIQEMLTRLLNILNVS